eukprot:GFKZ01012523.1.p1 GENE.GFKZ01012523.1~~GFKZ01012523.1.p1  ORF type:complete len:775 (-),score=94.69 GFKZ01012523.1:1759-4083(-)
MTEKRMRKGPRGTARRPRCEDNYPSLENLSRTRFRTSDDVLFDVADTAVTPSRVMTRVISEARRAAQNPLKIESPPALVPLSDSGISQSGPETAYVSLRHDPHLLSNVAAEPLEVALQYCYFHTSPGRPEMNQASRTAWDKEFVQVSPRRLCELASAAYYLDICDLVDLTCRALAAIISGKTADQIRTTFHIENDLVQTLVFPPKLKGTAGLPRPQKRRVVAKKVLPASLGDDLADSDEHYSSQSGTPPSIPQLGRNTVEEVENWINGDGNSKKTSKKRRKKKKNKALSSAPECSAVEPSSLSKSTADIRSSNTSGELRAADSLAPSSPIETHDAHKQLTERSEMLVPRNATSLPTQSETQEIHGCPILTCNSSSSDDDVALVCIASRKEVEIAKAGMPVSSHFVSACDQRDVSQIAEPSSPPSSPPPADMSQRIIDEESKPVPKGLVWSALSGDQARPGYSKRNQQQQGHTSPEGPCNSTGRSDRGDRDPESISSKSILQVKSGSEIAGEGNYSVLIGSKGAFGRERYDKLCAVIYNDDHASSAIATKGMKKCGLPTVSQLGETLAKDCTTGSYPSLDSKPKNSEVPNMCDLSKAVLPGQSTGVDTKGVQSMHSGVGNASYIRCPSRMDKEVEDFENRLRIGDDDAEPNVFHASKRNEPLSRETLRNRQPVSQSVHPPSNNSKSNLSPDRIVSKKRVQVEYRAGEPSSHGFTQNRLRAVRREAQLLERERHLQQRVDALDKQITDLRTERENIRSELSFVVLELEQCRDETDL